MKKWLAVLLALCIVFSLFLTGCDKDDEVDTEETKSEATSEKAEEEEEEEMNEDGFTMSPKGELPIVSDGEATLNIMFYGSIDTDYSENYYFSEHLIPRTGINLEYTVVDTEQYKTKLNLLFTSGDAPDVVSGAGNGNTKFSSGQILGYYGQGLIYDLAPLVDEWSVNIVKFFEDTETWPGLKETSYTVDGKLLGLPALGTCVHCSIYQKMWINVAWLENVGKELPTTPEEVKDVLIAFRDEDANGNGDPNDEIPLAGCVSGSYTMLDGFLMMPFQYSDSNFERLAVDDDGMVYASYTQDGYREGLKYLADLWNEGLIHPDSFTQNRDDMKAPNTVETADQPRIYGMVPGAHHGYPAPTAGDDPGVKYRWRDYTCLVPLVGDAGQYTPDHTYKNLYDPGQMFIPTDCEYPELAFRWLDAQWDGYYYDRSSGTYALGDIGNMGIPGEEGSWDYAEEGTVCQDGNQAWYKKMNPDGYPGYEDNPEDHPYYGNINIRIYSGPNYHSGYALDPADATWEDDTPTALEQFLYSMTTENMAPYTYPLENTLPLVWTAEEDALSMSNYETQLKSTVDSYVAKFITGVLDINNDGDWAQFLDELDGIGLEDYLSLYQKAVDGE